MPNTMLIGMTNEMLNTVRCSRCHRPLRSSASRALGQGPRCAAIEAALTGLDARQQDKAREAIADRAVVRTSRPGIARVVSEDGTEVYAVSANGNCNCPWGLRRTTATVKTCWHPAAVKLDMTPRRVPAAALFILAA